MPVVKISFENGKKRTRKGVNGLKPPSKQLERASPLSHLLADQYPAECEKCQYPGGGDHDPVGDTC